MLDQTVIAALLIPFTTCLALVPIAVAIVFELCTSIKELLDQWVRPATHLASVSLSSLPNGRMSARRQRGR